VAAPAPAPPGPRALTRAIIAVLLIVVGVAGVGGGGAALALEMTRHATRAEQSAALQAEIASRWQRLPAGKIFPATVSYSTSDGDMSVTAHRVGIAPQASCAAALDLAVARLLSRYGCVTVLRATYVDVSGTMAVTAGVVVMKSVAAANEAVAFSGGGAPTAGVRTFSLPGTVADLFGNPQRRAFNSVSSIGSYVFLYAAGYTDGRVSGSATANPYFTDLGSGVVLSLQNVLTSRDRACSLKDVRC
jgi:Tfp pilus assembly protein PilV